MHNAQKVRKMKIIVLKCLFLIRDLLFKIIFQEKQHLKMLLPLFNVSHAIYKFFFFALSVLFLSIIRE